MFLYDSIAGNVYLPRFEGKKTLATKLKMLPFHTSKIEGPILYFWIRYRYLCCSKLKSVKESSHYHRGKKRSALIND